MDAASSPGDGLLFVRGLSRTSVDNLCRRYSTAVAIVNPNDAFVLGGSGEALDILAVDAIRMGAASAFLELGPGFALSNMLASTYPNIPSRSLDDFRTIQGVASWVTRFGSDAA